MLGEKAYLDVETRAFLNACLLECSSSLLRILDDQCTAMIRTQMLPQVFSSGLGATARHGQGLSHVDINLQTLPPDSILQVLHLANKTLSLFGGMVQQGALQTVPTFRLKNQQPGDYSSLRWQFLAMLRATRPGK